MKSIFSSRPLNTDFAVLLLRVSFGLLLVYHGYQKITMFDEILPKFPDLIGLGGKLSFILVIFAEFVCGLLVAVGLLTRLAIIPILITMIVVVFLAHGKDPFGVKELPVLFLLLCPVIFVLGSGKYSLDKLLLKK